MKTYRMLALVLVAFLLVTATATAAWPHIVTTPGIVSLHAKLAPYAHTGLYSVEYRQQVGWVGYSSDGHYVAELLTGLRAGYTVDLADTDMAGWPPPPPPKSISPDYYLCRTKGATGGYRITANCWPSPPNGWITGIQSVTFSTSMCNGKSYRMVNSGAWTGWWVLTTATTCTWHD